MPTNCQHNNPLLHSGTSQYGRVLKALNPSFAQVDEREAADLILFAKEYSKYLNYYNKDNEKDGNWMQIMQTDVSVVLATLSNQRIYEYLRFVRKELAWLADKKHTDVADLKDRFTSLFNFAYSWLYELEVQCQMLPDEWPFKSYLCDVIRSVFASLRYKLWQYYLRAKAELCTSSANLQPGFQLPFTVNNIENLQVQFWQSCWDYTPDIDQPFLPEFYGTTAVSKIRNLTVHNLFTGIFDSIFKHASVIAQRADASLQSSFTSYPKHAPHYALFLTFIQLFRHAQKDVNQFTQRHLNLYYRDILQLQMKPGVPDHVHLLVELQKNTAQHLLVKNTLFKAGKDAAGNELLYAAEKDVLINKASIAAIKSVLAIKKTGYEKIYQSIHATPVSNSADGNGEPITGEDKSWMTFGRSFASNLASFGCAIASHLLFMREGDRTVTLKFETEQPLPANPALFLVKPVADLTGEKGWEQATVSLFTKLTSTTFQLTCSLTGMATAIIPFSSAVHKDVFNTIYPVLRFKFTSTVNYNHQKEWAGIAIKKIELHVTVTGMKKLVVKNDLTVVDTAKPFMPFGPNPYAGSACIIGSKEIFQKRNATVVLNFEWDKVPQPEGIISHESLYQNGEPTTSTIDALHLIPNLNLDNFVVKVQVAHLANKAWSTASALQNLFTSREMFGDSLVNHAPSCVDPATLRANRLYTSYPEATFTASPLQYITFQVAEPIKPFFAPDEAYSNDAVAGFIKLELNRDFGHKDFIQRFSRLAGQQKTPPQDPYTPLAKGLTAGYTASLTLNFSPSAAKDVFQRNWQFFSLHPFGIREENHFLQNEPRFTLTPAFPNEGELYIQLENALKNTTVNILFEVSEGSANPLKKKQDVVWHYLAKNNQWKIFGKGKVADDTNGLLHSGIITFALPVDIADAPTLMGDKHKWIKVAVEENSDALCNLNDIKTQAIKALWTNIHNPSLVYSQATPANTISKLQVVNASVKKIEQPYESSGGRLTETDDKFYLRSSERLRHKKRAITIWDYERLVLEAFPEIYKVKCLNHTKVPISAGAVESGDNELAPGCVVVVPVPDISKLHSINPLRPLTSLDTLTAIETYLTNLTSGFVRLQVRNPVFEEVVVRCDVQFIGDEGAYYHDVLLDDLQRFMCPWAYTADRDIEFGGKVSKSTLINFIEERPYVQFLTRFRMFLRKNNVTIPADQEEIVASTARSILVIASKHLHFFEYENVVC